MDCLGWMHLFLCYWVYDRCMLLPSWSLKCLVCWFASADFPLTLENTFLFFLLCHHGDALCVCCRNKDAAQIRNAERALPGKNADTSNERPSASFPVPYNSNYSRGTMLFAEHSMDTTPPQEPLKFSARSSTDEFVRASTLFPELGSDRSHPCCYWPQIALPTTNEATPKFEFKQFQQHTCGDQSNDKSTESASTIKRQPAKRMRARNR